MKKKATAVQPEPQLSNGDDDNDDDDNDDKDNNNQQYCQLL